MTDRCFGTSQVVLEATGRATAVASSAGLDTSSILQADLAEIGSPVSLDPTETYFNDAFCAFEIEVPSSFSFVKVEILYDVSGQTFIGLSDSLENRSSD